MKKHIADGLNLRIDEGGHRMFAAPTGAGKSYFVGRMIEELYNNQQRFIILDTKTENHSGLITLPEIVELNISSRNTYKNVKELLKYPYILCKPSNIHIPISVIIENYRKILNFLWLYDTNRVVIAEEAHNWNKNSSVCDPLFEQIAREGRSKRFFIWFVTQRLQNFNLLLWSQCKFTYLWHFNIPPDIRYCGQMVPDFDKINKEELETHDVLVWDNNNYEIIKADRINRQTEHKG